MSGADLLSEVRKLHPDTIRMIVTAFTDFDQVLRSINEGQVERYITKPWDPTELQSTIAGASELYWKAKENRSLTEDVLHQERLVAIGTVTLGLVRELETIGQRFKTLDGIEAQSAERSQAGLELFQGGVRELSAVLRGLRLYSKRGLHDGPIAEVADLNQIVAKSTQIIRLFPVAKNNGVNFVAYSEPLLVEVDAERVKQVIVNLALHLLSGPRSESSSLVLRTRAEGAVAVVSLQGEDLEFSEESAIVLREGLLARSEQTQSAFWLLLAQRVLGDHGGEIRGSETDERIQLRLPISSAREE
jgi:hypothetical protein